MPPIKTSIYYINGLCYSIILIRYINKFCSDLFFPLNEFRHIIYLK